MGNQPRDGKRCPGCGYFEQYYPMSKAPDETGYCRRYAPRSRVYRPRLADEDAGDGDYLQFPIWPWVTPTDWCGEWRPRDKSR
jgi:hypothetical protein